MKTDRLALAVCAALVCVSLGLSWWAIARARAAESAAWDANSSAQAAMEEVEYLKKEINSLNVAVNEIKDQQSEARRREMLDRILR